MAKEKKKKRSKLNLQTPISKVRPMKIKSARYYIEHAREYPIIGCWVYAEWEESGITPVVVAREQPNDQIVFCVCLIDYWCLGIKDAYANANVSPSKFKTNLPKMCSGEEEKVSVEFAHELIYGAMEYAEQYGFKPHRDFTIQKADKVLDPPDMHPRKGVIEFGKDGQPFYASGPYDNEAKIDRILRTLKRTAGEGNYKFFIGMGPSDFFDDFDDFEELE
jgi:hypothetical protein